MTEAELKKQIIDALIISFDEMGFIPSVLMPDPEKAAKEWRDNLVDVINDLISENEELRGRLDKAVELKANVGDVVYMPWKLFRGKRKSNGGWVVGNLFVPDKRDTPTQICVGTNVVRITYDVLPETVGQYTGLTDKKGKRIFEGDIVDVEYDIQYVGVAAKRIGLFVVVFYDGCFMKQKKDGGLFHFIPSDKCEVVGNIHDNPELMMEAET